MKIHSIAERVAERADIDFSAALTRATAAAVKAGYDDLYLSDDIEIPDSDAAFIIETVSTSAVLDGTREIDDIADAVDRIATATLDRDAAIRKAIRAGVPVRQIAAAAQLSRERIYQIRDGRR